MRNAVYCAGRRKALFVVLASSRPLTCISCGVTCLARLPALFVLRGPLLQGPRNVILLFSVSLFSILCFAQDLAPRAYVITPIHGNAVTLAYSFYDGGILFDNALPITGANGKNNVPTISYYHTFSFFGRSANVTGALPYTVAHFQGNVNGTEGKIYRSGLMDAVFRFSVNIKGGPAMSAKEFLAWRQKTLLGASLKVVAPTGQYDPTLLINPGQNRWAFKPEFGFSQRRGKWVIDGYGAVWFFTTNSEFFSHNRMFPGINTQSQSPIGAFEGHLSHDLSRKVNPRFWVSLDGNFWFGGRTSLNGIVNPNTLQKNSRIGGTVSIPVSKHQSLKFSYNYGAYIRFGGNYHSLSAAWQYSWLGTPWKHPQRDDSGGH